MNNKNVENIKDVIPEPSFGLIGDYNNGLRDENYIIIDKEKRDNFYEQTNSKYQNRE